MTAQSKPRMTVPEFLDWASAQPRGRYELVRGEVVAMAPERARHNLVKLEVVLALRNAVRRAGLPCTVFTDGMTAVIDDEHSREPDAAVQCGVSTDLDSMVLEAPLIRTFHCLRLESRGGPGLRLNLFCNVVSM